MGHILAKNIICGHLANMHESQSNSASEISHRHIYFSAFGNPPCRVTHLLTVALNSNGGNSHVVPSPFPLKLFNLASPR